MLAELFWESKPPLWVISYANRYRINQLSVSIGFDLLRKQYKLRTQWFIVYVVFKSSHLQYVHYFFDHKKGTVLRASIESFPKYFQNGLFLSSVRCKWLLKVNNIPLHLWCLIWFLLDLHWMYKTCSFHDIIPCKSLWNNLTIILNIVFSAVRNWCTKPKLKDKKT
jgi:hypothetical protein